MFLKSATNWGWVPEQCDAELLALMLTRWGFITTDDHPLETQPIDTIWIPIDCELDLLKGGSLHWKNALDNLDLFGINPKGAILKEQGHAPNHWTIYPIVYKDGSYRSLDEDSGVILISYIFEGAASLT